MCDGRRTATVWKSRQSGVKATMLERETHTHPFNDHLSGTTQVSRYQKGKTNLDFTEARDSEWPWHQMGHLQICTSLWTNSHASTPPLSFLQAGCPYCRPTSSFKALLEREKQRERILLLPVKFNMPVAI